MTILSSRWTARRLARGRAAAILLVLAVFAGLATRVVFEAASPTFTSDTFHNLLLSRSLMEGRGFVSGGSEHPDASRTVLFPAMVAALGLVTHNVETAARVIVLLSGALIVVPMFFLARSAFGPAAALATLPLGALSCLAWASSRILVTSVFALLVLTTMSLGWSAARRNSRIAWVAAGACAGFTALARPEGIAFPLVLIVWTLVAGGGIRRRGGFRGPRRAARAAIVVTAFVVIYAPYVVWASSRLGRFAPWPGIEYVQAERRVSDHLSLREFSSPVVWTTRARFMLTADHRARFLETYFMTGDFPQADRDVTPPKAEPAAAGRPAPPAEPWRAVARRRWNIVRGNLLTAPRQAGWAHFLPPVVVLLASIGLAAALSTRRGRFALLLLALSGVGSFAPLASHIEARFFYPPFAIGAVLAAGGWGALASLLARSGLPVIRRRPSRIALHGVLFVGIAVSGLRHDTPRNEATSRASLLRATSAAWKDEIPPGPMLALSQHFPYWSGHAYRPIPFATLEGVLDYARAQGATSLVLEGRRDLDERPDLEWLTSKELPPQFRLLDAVPYPKGGELRLFAVELPKTPR